MSFVIVPDSLSNAIYKAIDAATADIPMAIVDREIFYNQLLDYFNEHGEIPEFSIVKNDATATNQTIEQEGRE